MNAIYRTAGGADRIRRWCLDRLDRWSVPHRRSLITTAAGETHVVTTGTGAPSVVLVAGTNFNAATCLPLAAALAQRWPTAIVDVPGQPGLSAPVRPRADALAWYGRWLGEVIDQLAEEPVVVVGHSLGAGIALACESPRISGRVLIAPAGLVRLRISMGVLATTLPWLARPTDQRSTRLLRMMHGPGYDPSPTLARWMTLVARDCRTSLAPAPLPAAVLQSLRGSPIVVATGEHDLFLPPARLRPAAESLDVDVQPLAGLGHLAPDEAPDRLVAMVDEVRQPG